MIICKTIEGLRRAVLHLSPFSSKRGFVPTMGALHQGHLSLVQAALDADCFTIVSIFVNPTQFNDAADFERYPITLEKDIQMLEQAGCHLLFLPSVAEIYPDGRDNKEPFELGSLETLLEGKYRPGHFQGVCQVVNRLLTITEPGQLFMGQKDFQQCMVVRRLLGLTGLKVQLNVVPTIREADGLAMSSRNLRLGENDRIRAASIYKQLTFLANQIGKMPVKILEAQATANLLSDGFSVVDYVAVADAETLEPAQDTIFTRPIVALVAASIGGVRLIDNLQIFEPLPTSVRS